MKFTTEELRAEIEAGRLPGIAVALAMCNEIEKSHKRIENLRYVLIKLSSSTDSKMTEMDCNYAMDADNEAAGDTGDE